MMEDCCTVDSLSVNKLFVRLIIEIWKPLIYGKENAINPLLRRTGFDLKDHQYLLQTSIKHHS